VHLDHRGELAADHLPLRGGAHRDRKPKRTSLEPGLSKFLPGQRLPLPVFARRRGHDTRIRLGRQAHQLKESTCRISRSIDERWLRGMLAGTAVSFGLPPLEAMFNANGTAYAAGGRFLEGSRLFLGQRREARPLDPMGTGATWMRTSKRPRSRRSRSMSRSSRACRSRRATSRDTTRVPSASSPVARW